MCKWRIRVSVSNMEQRIKSCLEQKSDQLTEVTVGVALISSHHFHIRAACGHPRRVLPPRAAGTLVS